MKKPYLILALLLPALQFLSAQGYNVIYVVNEGDPALCVADFDPEWAVPMPYASIPGAQNENSGADFYFTDIKLRIDSIFNACFVERGPLLSKILDEQKIGSSELADPNMSIKLGRLSLAAFFVFFTYSYDDENFFYNYRVVASATGELIFAHTRIIRKDYGIERKGTSIPEWEKEEKLMNEAYNKIINEEADNISKAIADYAYENGLTIMSDRRKKVSNSELFK